jgi:putative addiction module component (TIGR02574 family)
MAKAQRHVPRDKPAVGALQLGRQSDWKSRKEALQYDERREFVGIRKGVFVMSEAMVHLLESALHLSDSERGELAARLIESLEPTEEVENHELAEAWATEIAQRLADLDQGRVQTIPWPEARRMIFDDSPFDGDG